jgi:hypothetical protein
VKIEKKFPFQVLLTLLAGLAIAVALIAITGTREMMIAVFVGAALSTLNVLAGFLAIEYTHGKSPQVFLGVVLGGMGVRMALTLGLLIVLIKAAGIHANALVVSVLSFYIVFLALELMYIQKRFLGKPKS